MGDDSADRRSDAELLEAVREGDLSACDALFRQHAAAAHRAAAHWVSDPAEREDLVAEAFLRVLIAVRGGAGPQERLRPYLMVTMRNLAIAWNKQSRRVDLYGTTPDTSATVSAGSDDVVVGRWSARLAWSAYSSLPERWRKVLWHTAVEGTPPADLAPALGMSPNAVAVLAMRAREGLRRAYLQAHVPETSRLRCHRVRPRMGAWVRHGVSDRRARIIRAHLAECADCRSVAAMLTEVDCGIRPPAGAQAEDRTGLVGVLMFPSGLQLSGLPTALGGAVGAGAGKVAVFTMVAVLAVAGAPAPGREPGTAPALPPVASRPAPTSTGQPVAPAGTATPAPSSVPAPEPRGHGQKGIANGKSSDHPTGRANGNQSNGNQSNGSRANGIEHSAAPPPRATPAKPTRPTKPMSPSSPGRPRSPQKSK